MRNLIVLAALLWSTLCPAQQVWGDSELDRRVLRLSGELRCLVCQNQTLADSNAQLALDLKKELREKLANGMSDQQAIDFMVQRYGDFVLYKPRLQASTMLLWFGPFVFLFGGVIALLRFIRKRQGEEGA